MFTRLLNQAPTALLTGEPAEPFWSQGFSMLPVLMGTAPSGGEVVTGDGSTGTASGGSGSGSTTDPAGGDGAEGTAAEENVPLTKFRQQEEQLRAADRRREEAEKKLKEIADKDKSEIERASGKVQELTEQLTQLQQANKELLLQNAFLTSNTYKWKDPEDALYLAQRKGFLDDAMDADGKVDGEKVRKGLKAFADKHGHLIDASTEEPGKGKGGQTAPTPTPGTPVGSNATGTGTDKGPDDTALKSRYRALRY